MEELNGFQEDFPRYSKSNLHISAIPIILAPQKN